MAFTNSFFYDQFFPVLTKLKDLNVFLFCFVQLYVYQLLAIQSLSATFEFIDQCKFWALLE